MAINSITTDWRKSRVGKNLTGRYGTKVFVVEISTDTDLDTAIVEARDNGSIPQKWDVHPADPWLFVDDINVEPLAGESKFNFEVTVNYKSIEDPLSQPPEISWSFVTSNEPIDRDIYGFPITNSADESFDPPISRDVDDLLLRYKRNEGTFNALLASEYKSAVNADIFYGFSPGLCKVNVIEGVRMRAGDLLYWEVSYEIQFRWDGWARRILDEGYRELRKSAGVPILSNGARTYNMIRDNEDNSMARPTLLDGAGEKLKDGFPTVFLVYDVYRAVPFSVLNIIL